MLERYVDGFLRAAKARGIDRLFFYAEETERRAASVRGGTLEQAESSKEALLFVEAEVDGRAGSVFIEDLDPARYEEHIACLRSGAAAGGRAYVSRTIPEMAPPPPAPELTGLARMEELLRSAERAALAADPRVSQVSRCRLWEQIRTVTLLDESGRRASDRVARGGFHLSAVAREGAAVQMGAAGEAFRLGHLPDLEELARQAALDAAEKLTASSWATGLSPVVLDRRVACELLDAFLPAFYARNAARGMSVLAGQEGRAAAGQRVTLREIPALPEGLNCRRFDDEGDTAQEKTILENGVLKTFLYDAETARQAGRRGGNSYKQSYAADAGPGYTNLALQPGEKDRDGLLAEMGNGLLITGVSGVFAGADPASGEFSLIAQGRKIADGKIAGSVSRITVAGNFFAMLKDVEAVGSDSGWMCSGVGCILAPSLYVKRLMISGEEA